MIFAVLGPTFMVLVWAEIILVYCMYRDLSFAWLFVELLWHFRDGFETLFGMVPKEFVKELHKFTKIL